MPEPKAQITTAPPRILLETAPKKTEPGKTAEPRPDMVTGYFEGPTVKQVLTGILKGNTALRHEFTSGKL